MNCKQAQKQFVLFAEARLPAELKTHLDGCPDCRAAYAQTETVRKLMRLKQYEKPASGSMERCIADVNRRIRQLESEPESAKSIWDFLTAPSQGLRFAGVAAVLALIALNFVFVGQQPQSDLGFSATVISNQPTAPVLVQSAPVTSTQTPPQVIVLASNRGPANVQYGPGASVPVRFDY